MSEAEWINEAPEEWRETIRKSAHASTSKSLDEWAGHINNDAAWRGQSIRVPTEDADESVWQEFHQKLRSKVPSLMPTPMDDESEIAAYGQMGMPEKPEGYKVPEGISLSDAESYKAVAHSLNMTQRVFDKWVQMEAMGHSDRSAAMAEALEEGYNGLRAEWGAAFDENYARVGDLLREAPEGVIEAYKNRQLPPDQAKWLYSLAELAGEPVEATNQQGQGVLTPEQASLELEDFKPKFYAMKKHDPGYKAALAKFERLMKLRMGVAA